VISSFHLEVDENCAFLGYYAASSGNDVNILRQTMAYAAPMYTLVEIWMFSLVFSQALFMSQPAVKFSKAKKCLRS
jgi:hypothetical protein